MSVVPPNLPSSTDAGHTGTPLDPEGLKAGEMKILVLAPTSNDAQLTAQFLRKAGMDPFVCTDFAQVSQMTEAGCGAILLAEEVLAKDSVKQFTVRLGQQPSWSDLPIVVITGVREAAARRRLLSALEPTGNVSVIERPVRPDTLVSTLEFALRSRRRQYQVRSLLQERERMAAAAQEADKRKDEFLAMLAHELRNPLASVANAAALLKTSQDHETQDWAAGVIERQSNQLAILIDDLLDVSRITTGKIRLRQTIVDASVILDRACETARPLMTERGHDLICDYPRQKLWLRVDPTRIEQIILNLLSNAAKYTPKDGRIHLSAARQGADISITVSDNGIGIAPERLPDMFQLFTQGERSIARSEGGLGIGLTIVQRLTEMHGGRIEAQSEGPGCGSTFTILLPAAAPPSPAQGGSGNPSRQAPKPLRILVVDDNVDSAAGLSRLLGRSGHTVAMAFDGHEALDHARSQAPEAIVLDIGLPGMDGYEVARRLRQEPGCSQALIIAVTGYGQDEDRLRALEAGFDHHLVKPVDIAKLRTLLNKDGARQKTAL